MEEQNNNQQQIVSSNVDFVEAVPVELCGTCKIEKVNGKCQNCGRPTKYTNDEEMVAKVEAYIKTCVDVEKETDRGTFVIVRLPKREGLADFIGVDEDTLKNWGEKYPKFFGALKKIDRAQKGRLIDNGLAGTYNPTIAKLLLSANHGMREKSDVTTDDKPIEGLVVTFIKPDDTKTGASS